MSETGDSSPAMAMDAPFVSARRATVSVQIYAHLRRQIVTGVLRPMQYVSEKELATALGVSRTPVREALGKLEEEGLVQIRPQYGTFVAPIRADVVFASKFVREAIECAGVRLAAERCTAQDAAELRDFLARQRNAASETAFFEADDGMHRKLISVAGQESAWRVLDGVKAALDRVRFLSMMRLTKRQETLAEHSRIIERVIAHDPAGAAEAMSAHLNGTFASVEYAMQQHPEFFHDQPEDARPTRRRG